jgi:hypothetical protein
MFPITNLDCAEDHSSLSSAQLCAFPALKCKFNSGIIADKICPPENCPQNHGETLMAFEPAHNKLTPVLVGFSSSKNSCILGKPLIFTRILEYRDWIEQILNFSDEFLVFGD